MDDTLKNKYQKYEISRKEYTDAILHSTANKKIVIAGPGTGKSFLFQEVCKKNIKDGKNKNLTLSFINELVDDLAKDLHKLSDVKTLHGFALGIIHEKPKMFLDLGQIIEDDYKIIIKDEPIDFNDIFCNLKEAPVQLAFYSKRRKYYDHFSPNCSVYTLIKIFEKDPSKIPAYSQLLVDEFQDFNKLESKVIELLSDRSPTLIVGDDDQSLYSFKHADPCNIRSKHKSDEYESFQLPFCSRCTEVIINAFANILNKAKELGFLTDRIPKNYQYFPTSEKDKLSSENPKILAKKKVHQKTVAFHIDKEIKNIFDPRSKQLPSVLIICSLKQQIVDLEKRLRALGYRNIDASQKYDKNSLMDGILLLMADKKCNLGWRIVSEQVYKKNKIDDKFKEIVIKSYGSGTPFFELIGKEEKKYIKRILASFNKIKKGTISEDERKEIFDFIEYDPNKIALDKLQKELELDQRKKNIYKDVPIKITTILGSKGLTKDYSFLVNFDDKYLLDKGVVTDANVCCFLVALTRARLKTYIYTSGQKFPKFVDWIGNEFYEEI